MAEATAGNDAKTMGKVRSAATHTISQPADPSVKSTPTHKVDLVTPARHAGRTMSGKR